jgi:hypothetical protein
MTIREAIKKLIGIPPESTVPVVEIVQTPGYCVTTLSWQTGGHNYIYRCDDSQANVAKIKNRISGDAASRCFDWDTATMAKECFDWMGE